MPTSTSIIFAQDPAEEVRPPQRLDEEGAGGHMPTPDGDDSVDMMMTTMDLDLAEDSEDEISEVSIADRVNEAERSRHFDISD